MIANEAQKILRNAHEGTSKVRITNLQLLKTKFENMKINEDETIFEINVHLCDIVNISFPLVKK